MNSPFDELTKFQISKLFNLLHVHIYKYAKNQEILQTIKSENIIAIILNGQAQIIMTDYNGNEIILENLSKDSIFGPSISGTDSEDYEILAKEDTEVVIIDYKELMNPINLKYSYFNTFFRNLFDIINTRLKDKNRRIKILEKKQIREKLLAYFELRYTETNSRVLYLPFSLKDLADYMAVNRSAMFRELKNLKEENFVAVKGKRITLLYK